MDTRIERRDIIAVLLIPAQLLLGWLLSLTPLKSSAVLIVATLAAEAISVWVLFRMYAGTLWQDWEKFRHKLWVKILIAIAGAVALHVVLYLVRMLPFVRGGVSGGEDAASPTIALLLLGSLIPCLAPFQEEIIFRHALFYKFSKKRMLVPVLMIVSSILFGLIHLNNFDGQVMRTIPYMIIGLCFALTYWFTKNIWYSISVHFVFNFTNSLLPTIFLAIMQSFVRPPLPT